MRLGATDFALPATIFCSLTSGVQKLEIFNYTIKFGLVMLTILAAAKNFAMSHRNKNFKPGDLNRGYLYPLGVRNTKAGGTR